MNELAALDRTLRLVHLDLFPNVDPEAVLARLMASRIRLRATNRNLSTPSGQTAFVTTFLLLNEMGFSISLDISDDVPTRAQPPVADGLLKSSIYALSDRLLGPINEDLDPRVEVLFGDTHPSGTDSFVLRLEAAAWCTRVTDGRAPAAPITGDSPFAPALGSAAVAAEVFRWAMSDLGRSVGQEPLPEHYLGDVSEVSIELSPLNPSNVNLGHVDVISAGALTTAAIYLLLRVPGVRGSMRVFDDDRAAINNLNRYLLLTRKVIGQRKVDILSAYQRNEFAIQPVPLRVTDESLELLPLAPRVLVGVDDIPSRWVAQRHAKGWIGVAATSHFETVVSEHDPTSPCCGCLHPQADDGVAGPIPTISFVSAFAGFLLAYRLVRSVVVGPETNATLAYPFNLAAERGMALINCAPRPDCPVKCDASRKTLLAQT